MNIILILIAVVLGLLLSGFLLETAFTLLDQQRYRTGTGQLLDVEGHRLHILVMGERVKGKPAIVLDAGIGNNSLDWQKVQPKLAEFAQAVSYDRAGYGWSDDGPKPRSNERIVEELHTLLQKAEIEPPYLLVGHSFGGLYVRLFAQKYPGETAGLVLLDASHPELIAARDTGPELRRLKNVQRLQRIGLVRLMLPRILNRANQLSDEARKQYLALNLSDNRTAIHEAEALFKNGIELSDSVTIPLTVVSRAEDEELSGERRWSEYQHELAALSPNAKHIHATTGSHWIALAEPNTVVNAIREMYDSLSEHV